MVVLLYQNNGEQYEDYAEWVSKVYDVKMPKAEIEKCEKDPDYLDKTYRAWFKYYIWLELNITVNPHWIETIMKDSIVKSKKLFNEIKRENTLSRKLLSYQRTW